MAPKVPKEIMKALKEIDNDIEVTTIYSVNGGCINETFHYVTTKGEYFVKINKKNESYDMFKAEREGLLEINIAVKGFAPKPLKLGFLNENKKGGAFLIMEYIQLKNVNTREIQVALAKKIVQMHKHFPTNLKYGFSIPTMCGSTQQDNYWEEDWVTFLKKRRLIPIIHHCINVSSNPKDFKEKADFLVNNLHLLFEDYVPQPSLIHGDLCEYL